MRFIVASAWSMLLIGPLAPRLRVDGGVLGGQAERVEPDGMQHVEAAHPSLPSHSIADGVVARMARRGRSPDG